MTFCDRQTQTALFGTMLYDPFCVQILCTKLCDDWSGEEWGLKHNVTMTLIFPKQFGDVPLASYNENSV